MWCRKCTCASTSTSHESGAITNQRIVGAIPSIELAPKGEAAVLMSTSNSMKPNRARSAGRRLRRRSHLRPEAAVLPGGVRQPAAIMRSNLEGEEGTGRATLAKEKKTVKAGKKFRCGCATATFSAAKMGDVYVNGLRTHRAPRRWSEQGKMPAGGPLCRR